MTLIVRATGPYACIQDAGRSGLAHQGVPRSGAADRAAYALGNRLVGNAPGQPAIEVTAGGLSIETTRSAWFATAGAPAPIRVDGRPHGPASVFFAPAGSTVSMGRAPRGLRTYLAVRGGLVVPPVLGSASEDSLSGLRPLPLAEGTVIPVGPGLALERTALVDQAPQPELPVEPIVRVLPGPRRDWMTEEAWQALVTSSYEVTAQSNRVGVRLAGPMLDRAITDELPSEGIIPGAVQLPPSRQPIIFLADVPTTGGYPVVAVVPERDLSTVAQLVPGQHVRLRELH